jgi:ABC-2 type transport system permease protein
MIAVRVAEVFMVGSLVLMLPSTLQFFRIESDPLLAPPLGIALGMLGGCMWPLEVVGSTMKTVGHLVPQAWAMDAFVTLVAKGGDLAAIAPQLVVLLGYAAVLLPLATWRLRAALTS